MKIITPSYIYTNKQLLTGIAIAFEKKIKAVDSLENLQKKYPNAEVIKLKKNSLLMPGLINSHVHLEFSANKSTLKYGSFMPWLFSVIENREELINECSVDCMKKATDEMLQSGTTTFGAISSHGMDLDAAAQAKQNVIFFNELIGSQAVMADALYGDFFRRYKEAKSIERENFQSAIAIHSPYSVHPVLIKKALQLATDENVLTTAHFMESHAEREWLDKSEGAFKPFFKEFLKQDIAVSNAEEFLELFDNHPTLFTHAIHMNEKEYKSMKQNEHKLIHCPISNRLLGNGVLDLEEVKKHNIDFMVATDGLSSNYTLNLFEEMKVALFMHQHLEINTLAKELIESVTQTAAKALQLNKGLIEVGYDSDFIVLDLEQEASEDIATHIILQQYDVTQVFINGNQEI